MLDAVIEVAGADDVDEIVPLLARQLEDHRVAIDRARLARAVRGLVTRAERGAVLVAREAGRGRTRVIGIAVLAYTWTVEHGGHCTWLDELYVAPEHRERGLGTRLLEAALAHAAQDGCAAMDLEVDADHARVESLYRRYGFDALPRRRFAKRLR